MVTNVMTVNVQYPKPKIQIERKLIFIVIVFACVLSLWYSFAFTVYSHILIRVRTLTRSQCFVLYFVRMVSVLSLSRHYNSIAKCRRFRLVDYCYCYFLAIIFLLGWFCVWCVYVLHVLLTTTTTSDMIQQKHSSTGRIYTMRWQLRTV